MRFERKYLFKRVELDLLLKDLQNICTNIREYGVSSIYFDNIHESAYFQKIDGNKDKIKIRARNYDASLELINLEAKIKYSDKSYKLKSRISKEELDLLMLRNFVDLKNKNEDDDIREIYYYYKYYGMQRKISVQYTRLEMDLKSSCKTRLTIDRDVYSSMMVGGADKEITKMPCLSKDLCVLEVKSFNSSIDSYVKFLINKFKMKQEAVSKYALGVQAQKINMDNG
jgi:hypothetical protein